MRTCHPPKTLPALLLAAALCPTAARADAEPEPGEQTRDAEEAREEGLLAPLLDLNLEGLPRRRQRPLVRAPSTVTVLDARDLQDPAARFLDDVLRKVPGLQVMRTTATSADVSARGYNNISTTAQGMLALVDGRLAYNEWLGNVLWDALPVQFAGIEKIGVVRGPGSFLQGPNAMHGLVSIETRSPLDHPEGTAVLGGSVGNGDSTRAHALFVHRKERVGLKATLGWDDIGRFDGPAERGVGELPLDGGSDKNFAELRLGGRLGLSHRLEVTGGVSQLDLDLAAPGLFAVPPLEFLNEVEERFLKINHDWESAAGGDRRPAAFAAQLFWTGFDALIAPSAVYSGFRLDLDTLDLGLRYSPPTSRRHRLTLGAGHRHASFSTADQDIADGRHSTDLTWAFAQDEIAFSDDTLFLTLGLRVDEHSASGTNVSPRVALVWTFDPVRDAQGRAVRDRQGDVVPRRSLRASAGFGFRNPSLRELWSNWPLAFTDPMGDDVEALVAGNEHLRAEEMRSFEVGYHRYYYARRGERLSSLRGSLSVSAFFNLVDDLIVYEAVPAAPLELKPFNSFDQEAYGLEGEARLVFQSHGGRLSAFGNYSYVHRSDRDSGERIRDAPEHVLSAGLRLAPPAAGRGFSARLWATRFDSIVVSDEEDGDVGSYVHLNAELAYALPVGESQGRVFVRGTNLVDEHREHPAGRLYGALVEGGLGFQW